MRKNKNRPSWQRKFKKIYASTVLLLLVGVFLLPQLAYASAINDENIIEITNQVRSTEGLDSLSANQLLSKAAYDKADAIFKEQAFKHDLENKKFSSWVKEAGYEYESVGENLAIDFVSSEGAMEAWLKSPSHKKNILNPKFEEIGVAVKTDSFEGHKSLLIVQIFGTPADSKSGITKTTDDIIDINDSTTVNTEDQDTMLLTNSAPHTLLVTNTNSGVSVYGNPNYLNNTNSLYGIEMETIEQAVIYIIDYSSTFLMNYYWTVIALLLGVFSSSFIWHKRKYA